MIKSIIFLSLYTAAGIGSWGAYSVISEQDTSLNSLTKLASQVLPKMENQNNHSDSNIIYRWKDYNGNWTYEDQPYSELNFDTYEDELRFLQKLQENRKQLISPTTKKKEEETESSMASLSPMAQIQKLFEDAKNVQNLVNARQDQIDEITK